MRPCPACVCHAPNANDRPVPEPYHGNMNSPIQCHILIGIPGSGKTTLAQHWCNHDPRCHHISTDQIRQALYGHAIEQGTWDEIEREILHQAIEAIGAGRTIIYDATNAQRPHRFAILHQLRHHLQPIAGDRPLHFYGWPLDTALEHCHRRNRHRHRTIPAEILDTMHDALVAFPPDRAEGFISLHTPPSLNDDPNTLEWDFAAIDRLIAYSEKYHHLRTNRHCAADPHVYSHLFDFERLMHLLASLIPPSPRGQYRDRAQILTNLEQRGLGIYANPEAIATDLDWLERLGLIRTEIDRHTETPHFGLDAIPTASDYDAALGHRYSDRETFYRLLTVIDAIVRHPHPDHATKTQAARRLEEQVGGRLQWDGKALRDRLRRDIERVLYPYGILQPRESTPAYGSRLRGSPPDTLPKQRYRKAYFVGTSILSVEDLAWMYDAVSRTAHSLPEADFARFQSIGRRLEDARIVDPRHPATLDVIDPIDILDLSTTPKRSLRVQPDRLKVAIQAGERLHLKRFPQAGRYGDDAIEFYAYPLLLTHHNIDWYLGCQEAETKRFRFERLDRLQLMGYETPEYRSKGAQRQARRQLDRLRQASVGLFLGTLEQQRDYLSRDGQRRGRVIVALELQCTDRSFVFIRERSRRFGLDNLQLSDYAIALPLVGTGEREFRHWLKAEIPVWSVQDFDLWRWILGFGGEVRVVQPVALRETIAGMARAICGVYSETP